MYKIISVFKCKNSEDKERAVKVTTKKGGEKEFLAVQDLKRFYIKFLN